MKCLCVWFHFGSKLNHCRKASMLALSWRSFYATIHNKTDCAGSIEHTLDTELSLGKVGGESRSFLESAEILAFLRCCFLACPS